MHNTTAFSGGFKYKPTTSISFSSNRGSLDSFERLDQVRLQATSGPDPLYRGRRDPDRLGHRPAAPMRCPCRLFVLSQAHDLLNLLRRDHWLAPATFTHLAELGQPLGGEPVPPRPNRDRGNPHLRSDL